MCSSKKNGGRRCPSCYGKRVAVAENKLNKANLAVKNQISSVVELEAETLQEIKNLKEVIKTSNVKRVKERATNKIFRLNDELKKEKSKIYQLKEIAGNFAETLEDRYQTLELIKDESNEIVLEKLGNAIVVETYPDDSPEWHEQRAKGYGGSDIGAILGIKGAKSSRKEVIALKAGLKKQSTGSSGAAKIGHQFEPIVRRQFAERHPELQILTNKASWTHKKRTYQLANVDGFVSTESNGVPDAILEIKTSSNPNDWIDEEGKDKLPEYYRVQVLWYMSVFGFKKGYLAVLIDNNQYKEYEIVAKPGELGNIHKKVQEVQEEVKRINKVI